MTPSDSIEDVRGLKRKADNEPMLVEKKKKKRKKDKHSENHSLGLFNGEGPNGEERSKDYRNEKRQHKHKHNKTGHETNGDTSVGPVLDEKALRKEKKRKKKREREAAQHALNSPAHNQPATIIVPDSQVPQDADGDPGIPALHTVHASLYVPIPPIAQANAMQGLCADTLSPMLLTWQPTLRGVVLSYSNARFAGDRAPDGPGAALARIVDDYGPAFAWVAADFVVFRPARGVALRGYVNVQSESFVGLVVWNLFNATVERARLPRDWRWVEDGPEDEEEEEAGYADKEPALGRKGVPAPHGHYVDGHGAPVTQRLLPFRVTDFDPGFADGGESGAGAEARLERRFLSLQGTMLSAQQEEMLAKEERELVMRRRREGVSAWRGGIRRVPIRGVLKKGVGYDGGGKDGRFDGLLSDNR